MAGNREQQMYEITKQLEEGVKELFTSERYAEYLKTMSKFYNYSFNNTVLIALQRPEATLVAGYSAWQKNFHRQVKKGEKGIQIIAPSQRKEKEVVEKFDPETNEPILGPDGQPETEVVEHVVSDFRVVRVFDVSQTYGEPLQELAIQDLTEQVQNYPLFLQAVKEISPVPIRFGETGGKAKGYYSNKGKEIVVKEDMSESQTIKTLIHEIAHAKLHDREVLEQAGELEEAGYEEIILLAARVYGSRTRETLYREDSDLDVVLSYTGDIREDAFFNLLQENGMQIAGLKIDINPISLEKTGTLQEYMKRAEQYLDEREAEKQGRTPQETVQESKISFYAAECMEFPSMGEYYENLTLEEAVEKYKTIPEDRIHGIKGIGFCLEDGSIYDGEYELMSGGKISKDLIDLVPHYKKSPLVQKAMRDLERILAEKQRENTAEQAKSEGTMGRKVSVLKALKERKELLKKQEKKEETSHTRKKEAEL